VRGRSRSLAMNSTCQSVPGSDKDLPRYMRGTVAVSAKYSMSNASDHQVITTITRSVSPTKLRAKSPSKDISVFIPGRKAASFTSHQLSSELKRPSYSSEPRRRANNLDTKRSVGSPAPRMSPRRSR
jgi:hypothetical protein